MNEIWKLQDYSERIHHSLRNKAKNLGNQDSQNTIFQNKNEVRSQDKEKSFSDYMGKVSSSAISFPYNIQDEIQDDPYKKKLFDACVEFESIFVKLMLKEMKKSVQKNGLIHGGYAEEIFEDMLTDEQARQISRYDSFGLAEQIYKTLSKNL